MSNFKFIRDANITTKDYNSLKNGMSYNKFVQLVILSLFVMPTSQQKIIIV
ncbi:DUF3862 domain-containing protein [Streptococcus agalactiae]|uniref:DUF3862 domain-containing protein n=1 Tax=Streptococcus agalactiae TaxID=1311 RepID=UPI00376EDD40